MKKPFKYDVAISVAEEDKIVAEQIVAELKRRKVCYYYYEERTAESWGKYIINLTVDSFGRRARYVLLITSRIFVEKYWANLERQVALGDPAQSKPHILQLRLDDAPVDGLSKYVVYLDWKNNPKEIAGILKEKIRTEKLAEMRKVGVLVMIAVSVLVYFILTLKPPGAGIIRKMEKVLVIAPASLTKDNLIDSFYISNTEVTVAQYRAFCESQKKNLPPQLPLYYENGPVINVTWYEALAFCKWKEGRLPTEAEWEYAAGAGLLVKYSGSNNAGKVAIYNKKKPSYVATKKSNEFGLYDMTGNVAEWCDDWFDSSATWKAVRGGAYNSKITPVNELAIAYRTKEQPDARTPYIGFRVVWDKK